MSELGTAKVPHGRTLSDRTAAAAAVAAFLGAVLHRPVPLLVGATCGILALAFRRPRLLVVAMLLLTSEAGHRAFAGLRPTEARRFDGPVTLVADPTTTRFGVRVDVRAGRERLELRAGGASAGTVGRARAGERLMVKGRVAPPPPGAPWLVPRHVVGRLSVSAAEALDGGAWPWRAANRLRGLLSDGATVMPATTRSLYSGFVLGDDRDQPPEVVDDFRATGLTHLLVVSGQNVAYVLVLAGPILGRLRLTARWVATLVVIAAFGVVTRFEPSVLRASVMAAVAATAALSGRPAGSIRALALAVGALLLVDPLLAYSVGFQLSVAASLGIAVGAAPISRRIRAPAWLRDSIGVTIAAQVGVAPILLPRFGGLPVVSLVANLLSVPVAGLVTTWGLPAGVVAGLAERHLGTVAATALHLPTQAMIGWVAGVARIAARVPLGQIGTREALALTALVIAARLLHRHGHDTARPAATGRFVIAFAATAVVLSPAWRLRDPPDAAVVDGSSHITHVGTASVLVLGRNPSAAGLLKDLRELGVRRLDVLVSDGPPDALLLRALQHRWPIREILDSSGADRVVVNGTVVTLEAGGGTATGPPLGGHLGRDPPIGGRVAVTAHPPTQIAEQVPHQEHDDSELLVLTDVLQFVGHQVLGSRSGGPDDHEAPEGPRVGAGRDRAPDPQPVAGTPLDRQHGRSGCGQNSFLVRRRR